MTFEQDLIGRTEEFIQRNNIISLTKKPDRLRACEIRDQMIVWYWDMRRLENIHSLEAKCDIQH